MNSAQAAFTPPASPMSTERLNLEPLRVDHADEMVSVLAPTELYVYTGGEPPTLEQLTHRFTMQCAGSGRESEQWHNWIMRDQASQRTIGFVQATVEPSGTNIAWTVGVAWQGHGYAKEAATAMCAWLRSHDIAPCEAWIHADHVASQKIAQSLGLSLTNEVDEDGEQCWR